MKRILLLGITVLLSSCYVEQPQKLNIISGKLIDSPKNIVFSNYTLTARSIFGTKEETIANTVLNEDGSFRMEYYTKGSYTGNNLRISIYPPIAAQEKFEFLPYGESWHKDFYIGDSATLLLKTNISLLSTDSIVVTAYSKTYTFVGPIFNNLLGVIKIGNYRQHSIFYKKNMNDEQFVLVNPTGDPIVDTLTLEINP